ncbi:GNAT family N-acetyltransferase [Macrococcus sp. DPC7161]|uniref:GNAT family N-acetyltransferase n=1 Tax=Macrococcus sp. DPC7161 TaxID=2507060 RepID=UPI00100BCBB8|nr:GNAT family N-acetyltransferase [Macrococcus sp. DPC7161]RXK17487.1 GNAT family N-acetyltransferase [Macrococcus sp. DPC7161]
MNLKLINEIKSETEKQCAYHLIQLFWKEHNNYIQNMEDAIEHYNQWTSVGHLFYLIEYENKNIGFVHLGSRGGQIDWLEDIFIIPEMQGKGIGRKVIFMIEEIVKKYSESLYLEVAARNLAALKLYYELGFNCLNTLTIRKDFQDQKFDVINNENINGYTFEVKKYKK